MIRGRTKQILIDINTQKDFFLAEGNACVGNHRRILSHIRRIMAWVRRKKILVISTCEVYSPNNGAAYCIDGTAGQKKIRYTKLQNRAVFKADNNTDFPVDILRKYQQVVLHKRCMDPFDEPRIERLLSELNANEFVLIGALIEGAIGAMALGLLQRGKRVYIVMDAVGSIDKLKAQHVLSKIKAKGARFIDTKRLAGTSHLKFTGVCKCERCREYSDKSQTVEA